MRRASIRPGLVTAISSLVVAPSSASTASSSAVTITTTTTTNTRQLGSRNALSTLVVLALLLWGVSLWPAALARQNQHQHQHQTCPGCPHQQHAHLHRAKDGVPAPDEIRLEAIKQQILTKLGLRNRPDVNRTLASVPKRLALETIYRAEAQQYAKPHPPPSERTQRRHHERFDHANRISNDPYEDAFGYGDQNAYENPPPASVDAFSSPFNDFEDGSSTGESDDDFYAKTSEIITFAEPGGSLNGQPLLEFPLSSSEPGLEPLNIKQAILWVRVKHKHPHHTRLQMSNPNDSKNITLWVFRVHVGNVTHLQGKELGDNLELVTRQAVSMANLGWQNFDVTHAVRQWYESTFTQATREKLTMLVDCTGCGSHVHIPTFGAGHSPPVVESSLNSRNSKGEERPFLAVLTEPTAVKRVRRRAIECNSAVKGQCCKQRFYVDFAHLGWDDWIIAPRGYYANYCRGDCAAGHRTPDTYPNYYTHVIEEYRKMNRLAGMQPCCAPLKFSSISLIYYGPESQIIKRDLPKMVVDECGCP